jgi:ubiquinone/menaquinone biosynthesis C-methylase UbiE
VEYGMEQALKYGVGNLHYRKGDLEAVPLKDKSADVALFSQSLHHAQHPEKAIAEAFRILKPQGRVVILDLVRHNFAEAREMYADLWLGFSEVELRRILRKAGFQHAHTSVVHRESIAPHFETLLAVADKQPSH